MIRGAKGDQLKMFMTGEEIQSKVTISPDRLPGETLPGMWQTKLSESKLPLSGGTHGAGVYQSMKSEGLRGGDDNVVELFHATSPHSTNPSLDREDVVIDRMHHRVAAGAELNTIFPVEHSESALSRKRLTSGEIVPKE